MKKKTGIMLVLLCVGIASLTGQRTSTTEDFNTQPSLNLCATDQYLNDEFYSTWSNEAKYALNITECLVGFGIGLICPPAGLGYAL